MNNYSWGIKSKRKVRIVKWIKSSGLTVHLYSGLRIAVIRMRILKCYIIYKHIPYYLKIKQTINLQTTLVFNISTAKARLYCKRMATQLAQCISSFKIFHDVMTDEIQEETTKPLTLCNLIDLIINHQLDEEPKFSLIEIDINGVAASLIHVLFFPS